MDSKLKIFYTVAQLKSFTRAAEVLGLTQPGVTFQIRNLEREFDVRLFDRGSHKIALTRAGKVLLKHTEAILEEYDRAKEEVGRIGGKRLGDIRIGIASLLGKYYLPRLIGHYKQKNPGVNIIMLVGNSGKLIQDFKDSLIDIAIVSEPFSSKNFVVKSFLEDELVVIVEPRHEWAHRQYIELEDLLIEPFVVREPGSGTREVLKEFLNARNMSMRDFNVILTLGSSEAVKSAVESGVGYGIVSNIAVRREVEAGLLKNIRIKGVTLKRRFLIAYSPEHYKKELIRDFLDFLFTNVKR